MSPIDRVRAILDGDKVGTFTSLAVRRPRLEWAQSDRPRREWQAWAQVRAEVFMPRGHAGEAGHRRGARGDVPTPGRLAD